MILSTAWTTPAILYGCKSETRRDWSEKQIALARKQMEEGKRIDLWTKSPRFKGEKYATARITYLIEKECSLDIPDEAWDREGFGFLTAINQEMQKGYFAPDVWRYWRQCAAADNVQTVVGFGDIEFELLGYSLMGDLAERLLVHPETIKNIGQTDLLNITLADLARVR